MFDDSMFGIFTMIAGPDGSFVGVAPVEFPQDPATAAARLVPAAKLPSVYSVVAGRDLRTALHDYEQRLVEHGFAAVRTGAANGHRFLGQNPLPA
ncbi:hypothetical protein [Nocardia sp. BSTN01]|uniref:hypothetical protein n=1 Tax=Nocardia sp. BSTN01 TaxID=2783665 RepID=UPI001E61920D|nr:hypothetical protein [Nocardia sp. BSTN01]